VAKDEEDAAKRRTLKVLIGAGTALFGSALAAPAVVFVAAPIPLVEPKGPNWVRTVRLDSLAEGEPKKISIVSVRYDAWNVERNVELGSVWLTRRGDKVTCFSTICPHLGCSINAQTGNEGFQCPCHTSAFDAEGKRIAGPSPRDMDPLLTHVEDGVVHVAFEKYRIGIPERVVLG
jgi:Rieske Fe-S protein